MQLSKRCEYALRALLDIAVAHELGKERVALNDLSNYEDIPLKFLEQILSQLRRAGYLHSKRGPSGGYSLGKPATKIFFGDVIRLLDGPLAPVRCASRTAYEKCTCPIEETCGLHLLMLDLRAAISGVLDRTSLAELVQRVRKEIKRDGGSFALIN